MLANTFFTVQNSDSADALSMRFDIQLNPSHKIYEGHFPEQPVVPGVVSMQIIKELTEMALNEKIRLQKAGNIKFLSPIIPEHNSELLVEINCKFVSENIRKIRASITAGKQVFVKMQADYLVL